MTEDDAVGVDASNAEDAAHNAHLFSAAQHIAEDIDPANREIRNLKPPQPTPIAEAWRAAQAETEAKNG